MKAKNTNFHKTTRLGLPSFINALKYCLNQERNQEALGSLDFSLKSQDK